MIPHSNPSGNHSTFEWFHQQCGLPIFVTSMLLYAFMTKPLCPVWVIRLVQSHRTTTSFLRLAHRSLTYEEVLLHGEPWVYFVWIQLLCLCWMIGSLTCLVKSKPVKQEFIHSVILPPMVSFLSCHHLYSVSPNYVDEKMLLHRKSQYQNFFPSRSQIFINHHLCRKKYCKEVFNPCQMLGDIWI